VATGFVGIGRRTTKMTALTAPLPFTGRHRIALLLDPAADPDAPMRVLGVLRRRGCEIAAVDYRRADRHAPARFEVAFDAPPATGRRAEDWLRNLVDVLEVRRA
jgi:acetolactate synthase regulatory subunit